MAKVSSRIGPMVRTKHFTACMRIPSHCYTKQQDSHLRAVLSGSFKVRLGAHGRFHSTVRDISEEGFLPFLCFVPSHEGCCLALDVIVPDLDK